MKRSICALLAVMLCMALLTPGLASSGWANPDLMVVYNCANAPMYDSYNQQSRNVLAYVPRDEIVYCIAAIDWGYCVAYGNDVGYIEERYLRMSTDSSDDFRLPGGSGHVPAQTPITNYNPYQVTSYVPEFPYSAVRCQANQTLATRSGPNTKYNEPGSYPRDTDVIVYYQTEGNGVAWGCVEFEHNDRYYRVYTGMKRLDTWQYVPMCDTENYTYATIATGHKPSYGPGNEYAFAPGYVDAGTRVRAYYQQYGWLMYEYELEDGKIQRAWAPQGYWY